MFEFGGMRCAVAELVILLSEWFRGLSGIS